MEENHLEMDYTNLELWRIGFSKEERDKIIEAARCSGYFGPIELGRALHRFLHSEMFANTNSSFREILKNVNQKIT
jgi:hypothetical protein